MTALTITSKGQVTIRKEVLAHLGVKPGDKIDIDRLPGGEVILRAVPSGDISAAFGILERVGGPSFTIEEINQAIVDGWAGQK